MPSTPDPTRSITLLRSALIDADAIVARRRAELAIAEAWRNGVAVKLDAAEASGGPRTHAPAPTTPPSRLTEIAEPVAVQPVAEAIAADRRLPDYKRLAANDDAHER
jgi:hypothetical protein